MLFNFAKTHMESKKNIYLEIFINNIYKYLKKFEKKTSMMIRKTFLLFLLEQEIEKL